MVRIQLEYLSWGGAGKGGEGALQYPFKPISDIFHGLEVSVERGGALWALFTDHGLFTMKLSANPEEMWAQDVLSLVMACFN